MFYKTNDHMTKDIWRDVRICVTMEKSDFRLFKVSLRTKNSSMTV